MLISGTKISENQAPFIIAELSGNHKQSLKIAEEMILAASEAGVNAIKLQTYTADTITLNSSRPEFQIQEKSSLWRGENLYSLYQKACTPWEWHRDLFSLAKEKGLIAFSSPFDETSVEFLETLDVPCYKIASFELNHYPLLRAVAQTGKPVIMSIGMSQLKEVEDAVAYLFKHGCKDLALLKCTSAYPAPIVDANLNTISDLKQRFSLPVGLSDHSQGIGVSLVAAALGADIIERHFVLDRNSDAVDAAFSSTPEEFALLVKESKQIKHALGKVHYGPTNSEHDSLKYRRSIYLCKERLAGDVLTQDDIKVVRPGLGLEPKLYDWVIGKKLKHNKLANTPLSLEDFL